MSGTCSSSSWALVTGLFYLLVASLLAVTLASLGSDIGFSMFTLRENLDGFLKEVEVGLTRYPEGGSTANLVLQRLPLVVRPFLLAAAGYSALIALEAAALLLAVRCEKSILFLPFLLHGLMDILLTLAAGGTLATGLFLSGGLVTGGLAVVAILILAGLGFASWRAVLAAYRRMVATAKTDDGETPVEHLASAPLHSHELLPLQRCTRTQKTLQKSCCLLFQRQTDVQRLTIHIS